MDRGVRTLTRGISKISNCVTTLPQVDRVVIDGTSTHNHTLELSLEPLKVTDVSLDQRLLTGWSEVLPHFTRRRGSTVTEGVSDIIDLHGVAPPDFVGDRIGDFEVVRKGTSGDLEIIIRVAPSTEPTRRGIVEDGCVGKVGAGIYDTEQNISIV